MWIIAGLASIKLTLLSGGGSASWTRKGEYLPWGWWLLHGWMMPNKHGFDWSILYTYC